MYHETAPGMEPFWIPIFLSVEFFSSLESVFSGPLHIAPTVNLETILEPHIISSYTIIRRLRQKVFMVCDQYICWVIQERKVLMFPNALYSFVRLVCRKKIPLRSGYTLLCSSSTWKKINSTMLAASGSGDKYCYWIDTRYARKMHIVFIKREATHIFEWMNEWMNEWTNERTKKRTNELLIYLSFVWQTYTPCSTNANTVCWWEPLKTPLSDRCSIASQIIFYIQGVYSLVSHCRI